MSLIESSVVTDSICSLNNTQPDKGCIPESVIAEEFKDKSLDNLYKNTSCNNISENGEKQLCLMEKLDKKDILIKYFKPVTKSFSHSHWLNNTEIDTVQYQFYVSYEGYYYSNIHMIDFGMFNPSNSEHIGYEPENIKNIDFYKELKGEGNLSDNGPLKKYGIVVNTDVSSGSGIHWFAIFIDFTGRDINIEYFNSSGYDIKDRSFKEFFINLADKLSFQTGRKCNFIKVSDIQHQNSGTSNCGVYALYYIWKRLGGESIDFFKKNKIDDNHIVLFRKYFFRKSE